MAHTPTPNDLTLALDTASPIQSLALVRGRDVLFESCSRSVSKEGPSLLTLVDTALRYCHVTIRDVERLVVSRGPGAFTGLRVSMAMLKSFAMTLDIPLYAASTLDALARNAQPFDGLVVPCIDARRGEIYAAFYKQNGDSVEKLSEELLLSPAAFNAHVDEHYAGERLLCLGPAFPTYRQKLRAAASQLFFTPTPVAPRAAALAWDVLERFPDTLPDIPLESLEPVYIRLDDFVTPKPFDFSQPQPRKHSGANA